MDSNTRGGPAACRAPTAAAAIPAAQRMQPGHGQPANRPPRLGQQGMPHTHTHTSTGPPDAHQQATPPSRHRLTAARRQLRPPTHTPNFAKTRNTTHQRQQLEPLDDVLGFREEHEAGHRANMRDLHGFLFELALVDDPAERAAALEQRREELAETARDLLHTTRRAFGVKLAALGIGIAGASWAVANGDPFGLIFDAAGYALRAAGVAANAKTEAVAAYSYIFDIRREFGAAS